MSDGGVIVFTIAFFLILFLVLIAILIIGALLVFKLISRLFKTHNSETKNTSLNNTQSSKAWQKKSSGIISMTDIDCMSPWNFELFLRDLFRKRGYVVDHVGKHFTHRYVSFYDYGADLIIEKEGKRTAVQAKHYKGDVGIDAVQEVYTSVNYYNCHDAAIITNSWYTHNAKELARVNGVKLWNRDDLRKVLSSVEPASL